MDQVALTCAVRAGVGQDFTHHVELVITRPDLFAFLPACLLVLRLDHLGVVLEDVGQALAGQHLAPQVVGLEAVRIGRVAGAVFPAPVEGQEPRGLAFEVGAKAHLAFVHGEVGYAAAELEELFARVAVLLVLPDRVMHRLLGETVFQLEGEYRQAVDEKTQVESELGLVAAIAELTGDGEAV